MIEVMNEYFEKDCMSDEDERNYTSETLNILYLHTKLLFAFNLECA